LATACTLAFAGCSQLYKSESTVFDEPVLLAARTIGPASSEPFELRSDGEVFEGTLDRLRGVVREVLLEKGLRVAEEPDLVGQAIVWIDYGSFVYATYAPGSRLPGYSSVPNRHGSIRIEFYDSESLKLVWRGEAEGFLEYDRPMSTSELKDEITRMFESWPPVAR
jgi:hypothetical protein